MLLVAILTNTKLCKTKFKTMIKILAHGYSFESTRPELSNEYQHDKVLDVFQKSLNTCGLDKSSLSIGRVNALMD